jgi:lactate racemase
MKIELAYGKTGLWIELPDAWDVTILEPDFEAGLENPAEALRAGLSSPIDELPLEQFISPAERVGIIFNDITRATPSALILRAVLERLSHLHPNQIKLFNALGTHRPNTEGELRQMLGDALVDHYAIVQNEAFAPASQVSLGKTHRGNEVFINRELAECDVKILTGFIEPHFFAGFSGGGKAVMPGMAGLATILNNHSANMIADPRATWGITHGNPIWEEVTEIAHMVGKTFLVNVTLNKEKAITHVFAGRLDQAHAAGCAAVRKHAMQPVSAPFDIVITSNSGYPLDLNLYQSVKGMSAAAQIVRQGGAILLSADCWDGIPAHGYYGELLRQAKSPADLLRTIHTPGFSRQDQWQAQVQAQIQEKVRVFLYSRNLTPAQIRAAMLEPVEDILAAVRALTQEASRPTRICVLPQGPVTIPYVAV